MTTLFERVVVNVRLIGEVLRDPILKSGNGEEVFTKDHSSSQTVFPVPVPPPVDERLEAVLAGGLARYHSSAP
jgi:hypothetical protein